MEAWIGPAVGLGLVVVAAFGWLLDGARREEARKAREAAKWIEATGATQVEAARQLRYAAEWRHGQHAWESWDGATCYLRVRRGAPRAVEFVEMERGYKARVPVDVLPGG